MPRPARIALVDGNAFFVSCERVFRPDLADRPVIVLSNNDGCAIARSNEAKALGIAMGTPWHEIRHLTHTQGLVALSSNFALYGDISSRMMTVIGQFSPAQEIYSVDECFIDLAGVPGTGRDLGAAIRARVLQWVGIPTCVGIGPTKTLAKLANHIAKKLPRLQGICDLTLATPEQRRRALGHVPVGDVWGIGRRLAPQLQALGIQTAADLAAADARVLRDQFSVIVAKTAMELGGQACLPWEDTPAPRQQIMVSRSFGRPVLTLDELQQALSLHASRAAEKLRRQGSRTLGVLVFARTSPFRPDPQYSGSVVVPLATPTDSTRVLLTAVHAGLRRIYRPGFKYSKAGVCLLDIARADAQQLQGALFEATPGADQPREPGALMSAVDALNQRFGRGSIGWASAAGRAGAAWNMKQERRTPAYTTDISQILQVWR